MRIADKRTKIVCTIGPSSWPPEVMKSMIDGGMNVARVNGAFADLDELQRVEELVWGISPEVALMLDIKGHEVRLNKFANAIQVKPGDIVEIGNSADYEIYPITYPDLYKDLQLGTRLVFNDGKLSAQVEEITQTGVIKCKILSGELFMPGKSINVPNVHLSNPPLTPRDKEQIEYCISREWDFISASFIRTVDDAQQVTKLTKGSHTKVIAKIEDQQGIDNFDAILAEVEGIMIARGDLGVEVPFERIPLIQKDFIKKCNVKGKVVITATQMLESMTTSPTPTRAEITDVANAIIDGTDAVMLSGETSTGQFPAEAVGVMSKIALEVEPHLKPRLYSERADVSPVSDALTKAAYQVATELGDEIKAIIVVTVTGRTAKLIGRYNLPLPIYAYVSEYAYVRRLSLSRGITKCFTLPKKYKDRDAAIQSIVEDIKSHKLIAAGKVLVVGSSASNESFFPNIFEVVELD
jgi:pyruvate kinase